MRFAPEANHGANAGLQHARARIETVKEYVFYLAHPSAVIDSDVKEIP